MFYSSMHMQVNYIRYSNIYYVNCAKTHVHLQILRQHRTKMIANNGQLVLLRQNWKRVWFKEINDQPFMEETAFFTLLSHPSQSILTLISTVCNIYIHVLGEVKLKFKNEKCKTLWFMDVAKKRKNSIDQIERNDDGTYLHRFAFALPCAGNAAYVWDMVEHAHTSRLIFKQFSNTGDYIHFGRDRRQRERERVVEREKELLHGRMWTTARRYIYIYKYCSITRHGFKFFVPRQCMFITVSLLVIFSRTSIYYIQILFFFNNRSDEPMITEH